MGVNVINGRIYGGKNGYSSRELKRGVLIDIPGKEFRILEVRGQFGIGDAVHCLDRNGKVIAAGLINYNSVDVDRIKQHHSQEIVELLGMKDYDEVIHRDNLVLL